MRLAFRFWAQLGLWTGVLLAILIIVSLLMGGTWASTIARLPVWGGLALVLAAYPGGIAVSRQVLSRERFQFRSLVEVSIAALAVCVLTFLLAGYVGPVVVRWVDPQAATAGDPATMVLGELRREMIAAVELAQQAMDTEARELWLDANKLSWHYFSRTDSSLLPLLFGWIGLMAGYWARMLPRMEMRQAQYWAMGLFLVIATYFAGENGYEMVVLRAVGPAAFAADFRLIVPGVLVIGLGWPTILSLWKQGQENLVT